VLSEYIDMLLDDIVLVVGVVEYQEVVHGFSL
jgi:hypothetical protein